MDNYIKTIINGLKTWVANRLNCLEENLGKKIDAAKSTADTANELAVIAKRTAESKADSQNPVFSGSFSQNRSQGTTIGDYSHAEGSGTTASGNYSHAEGFAATASGKGSHAEGLATTASGNYSHTEGSGTTASGNYSHAEGSGTTASGNYSHAQGTYNIEDTEGKYAHIVGNGSSIGKRSNAHTLDWNGTPWYQGRPQFGGNAQDDGAQTVMANGDSKITLKSPLGKLYIITVSDDGTLTTTEVTT